MLSIAPLKIESDIDSAAVSGFSLFCSHACLSGELSTRVFAKRVKLALEVLNCAIQF